MWVTDSPLSPSEMHPYPTGDVDALTSWDPVLLPRAGGHHPRAWVHLMNCESLSAAACLKAGSSWPDQEAALSGDDDFLHC